MQAQHAAARQPDARGHKKRGQTYEALVGVRRGDQGSDEDEAGQMNGS